MKNYVKASYYTAKNYVKTNKVAIVAVTVAIGAVALQQSNVKSFTKFLVQEGIDPDKYFVPEYYEEKQIEKGSPRKG